MTEDTAKKHIGRKIECIRELRGIKQIRLAKLMGVTQQTVSKLERSEEVDEDRLLKVATALGVTPEIIRNFNEESLFTNVQHNSDTASNNFIVNYQIHPIEKVVELHERLLQAEQEKNALMQALLKSEQEKNAMLQAQLDKL